MWIAFKNLIFDYWTQRRYFPKILPRRCELLSKILSLTIEHNCNRPRLCSWLVVNCFQKSYLWLLNTTILKCDLIEVVLWIAFKNLIFDYWTQRGVSGSLWPSGCELLSKILSLTIEHNLRAFQPQAEWVVNCFQKSYLWLLNTTI